MKALYLTVISLLIAVASGSEADLLPWQKLVITSEENAETGRVTVEANTQKGELLSLSIEAFGRKETLKAEDAKALSGFPLNSLIVTHEAGYEITGGHTVSLRLSRYFREEGEKLRKEIAYVSVSKNAPIRVSKHVEDP